MDPTLPYSLLDSFRWHLHSKNRSANTMANYPESIRQAEAYLASRGTTLIQATRADLEAFMAELLERRAPSTSPPATRRSMSSTSGSNDAREAHRRLSPGDRL
jgi:site-specific recombinase XerD